MADFGVSEVLMAASAAGSLMKASGSGMTASNYDLTAQRTQQAAALKAAQLRQAAGQQFAAAQRKGIEDKTTSALMASKLIAAAGASGGTGPQVNRLVSDVLSKGSYNTAMDIYNGEEAQRNLLMNADVTEYQGGIDAQGLSTKASAARLTGLGDLGTGAATLYAKYGGSGPRTYDGGTGGGAADTATYAANDWMAN